MLFALNHDLLTKKGYPVKQRNNMTINLFFSWQMTTNVKYNKNFILDCIRKAVAKLGKYPEFTSIRFEVLEGIGNEPGSPPVAARIADDRIPGSDIFIADISVANAWVDKKWVPKFVQNIFKDKHKPFQNNNVLFEYGVAYNALGVSKIICVLNTEYGSPSDNSDNLPFDIAHLRFPIKYNYSKENEGDKQTVQTSLVSELTRALKVAIIHALQSQKSKYPPLSVWSDWSDKTKLTHTFYRNQRINEVEAAVKKAIAERGASIRLLGLSGLGKTRILLELFRPQQDEASILLSSRVLYLNHNTNPNVPYETLLEAVARDKDDRIIILDNCPQDVHRSLLPIVDNHQNKLFLLTVNSNPEEILQSSISGVNYLVFSKNDLSSVVDDLLNEQLSALGKEKISKIKEFSQGIPLMAVLLVDSVKKNEDFIGIVDDKHLLNNLLGDKGKDERWRTILKSFALFSRIGVDDTLRSQLEFIATNEGITSLSDNPEFIKQEFYKVLHHFQQREIFEPQGRYVSMRPFPLAIYLAQEWLEVCSPPRLIKVLNDIAGLPEPDRSQLTTAFAEQMKYLGNDDRAKEILDKILGPSGPFDNAEVLDTELGSRLFRSFAEVNPVAVSQNFVRQLSRLSSDQLQAIRNGRRNLVWTLEKLCFDKRTFADSARILYSLAAAENETWANNATGQLLHLYSVLLAGTEADLNERWHLLEWGLAQGQTVYDELAVKAMRVGLNFGHFTRMNGGETQGTKTLLDYRPSDEEMAAYWTRIIARLEAFVEEQTPYAETASHILLNSLRGLSRAGQVHLLVSPLLRLATRHYVSGPEAVRAVRYTLRFEKDILKDDERTSLEELLTILDDGPNDFKTRYANVQNSAILLDERYSSERHQQQLVALADEFISQRLSWEEHFENLYRQRQPYSYYFGRRIYQLIQSEADQVARFIALSVKVLSEADAENRDLSLLAGFMSEATGAEKDSLYERLLASESMRCQLFYFVASDKDGYRHLELLHRLVTQGNCSVQAFAEMKYGGLLESLSHEQLMALSEQLFVYGTEGYRVVFDWCFSMAFNDEQQREQLLPILEKCVQYLGLAQVLNDKQYRYNGAQTIYWLLRDTSRSDFAATVNREIIASISWDNYYHLDSDAQRIYELLLKNHFAVVWPELSAALLAQDDNYVTYYGLKHILGSGIGSVSRTVGVLFTGDIDAIFTWCHAHQPLAPARLAELTPIFDRQEQTAPTYGQPRQIIPDAEEQPPVVPLSAWHPVAKRLIDEFGNLPDVLSNLEANMGSYSWTGSIVPLLRAEQRLFTALREHPLAAVMAWASQNLVRLDALIKHETNRDEEWAS